MYLLIGKYMPVLSAGIFDGIKSKFLIVYFSIFGFLALLGIIWMVVKSKHKKNSNDDDKIVAPKEIKPTIDMPDVESISDDGIVIFNHGTSFALYIEAQGNDYYERGLKGQSLIEDGYTSLFLFNQDSMTIHTQTHVNRLDKTFEKYQKGYDSLNESLTNMQAELRKYERMRKQDALSDEDISSLNKLEYETKKEIHALEGMIASNIAQQDRLMELTNDRNYPKRRNVYVIRYDHESINFAGVELSQAEIYERAYGELNGRANTIVSILFRASVKAHIVRDRNEVIDINRRHLRPRSGDFIRSNDLVKSNRYDVVTTSTSQRDKFVASL